MENSTYTVLSGDKRHELVFDSPGFDSGTINGQPFACEMHTDRNGEVEVLRNHVPYSVEILNVNEADKTMTVRVNGRRYTLQVRDKYDALLASLGMDNLDQRKVNDLKAPMPGLVLEVLVAEGAAVKKGDPLVVLEAMKMENILKSPADATIKKIGVQKGNAVEKNQILLEFNTN